MKTFLTGILAGLLLCAGALGQNPPAPPSNAQTPSSQNSATQPAQPAPSQSSPTPHFAPGSVIPVQLTKTIDVKKVKTGDQVEAKVTQDMKSGSGEVVVPKDSKVIGHITQAQARDKQQKESEVGIAFDSAVAKDGTDFPLPASIQAIISPAALNPNANANNGGEGQSASMPSGGSVPMGGRQPGMNTSPPPPTSSSPAQSTDWPKAPGNATPAITGNTQGVVGISNLKLSTSDAVQGSIVSSEKNNVKLESGTLMLLRVHQ